MQKSAKSPVNFYRVNTSMDSIPRSTKRMFSEPSHLHPILFPAKSAIVTSETTDYFKIELSTIHSFCIWFPLFSIFWVKFIHVVRTYSLIIILAVSSPVDKSTTSIACHALLINICGLQMVCYEYTSLYLSGNIY